GATFCLVRCAMILSRDRTPQEGQWMWAWLPLSLHAGWLSLAAFLNLAQVIVAYELASTTHQLPWSLALCALAARMLLAVNRRMRGNIDYVIAALWALVAVFVKQWDSGMAGARTAACVAIAIAVLLVLQTLVLRRRYPGGLLPNPARAGCSTAFDPHPRDPQPAPAVAPLLRRQLPRRHRLHLRELAGAFEATDVDRGAHAVAVVEHHRHQHAAATAQQEVRRTRALPITRQRPGIGDLQPQLAIGIGQPGRAMRPAETAIAGARRGLRRRQPAAQPQPQRTPMAPRREHLRHPAARRRPIGPRWVCWHEPRQLDRAMPMSMRRFACLLALLCGIGVAHAADRNSAQQMA